MFGISRRLAVYTCAIVAAFGMLCAPGCSNPDGYRAFVDASDVAMNDTIGPRYAQYVETDPALTVDQKVSYLGELQAFRMVIAEAKKDGASARGPP